VRLAGILYLIFALAVALRQLPDDDIRTTGHIKRALKKHGVADFEFVHGHGSLSLDESNDSTLMPGGITTLLTAKPSAMRKPTALPRQQEEEKATPFVRD
jgi:hypothetical protein